MALFMLKHTTYCLLSSANGDDVTWDLAVFNRQANRVSCRKLDGKRKTLTGSTFADPEVDMFYALSRDVEMNLVLYQFNSEFKEVSTQVITGPFVHVPVILSASDGRVLLGIP